MRRAESLGAAPIDTSRNLNSIWIIENARTLFDFASAKYRNHGSGVVQIDRNNVLRPPRYITVTEIKKNKLNHLEKFVERYDPRNSFVLLLDSNERGQPYRVDIIRTNPRSG